MLSIGAPAVRAVIVQLPLAYWPTIDPIDRVCALAGWLADAGRHVAILIALSTSAKSTFVLNVSAKVVVLVAVVALLISHVRFLD